MATHHGGLRQPLDRDADVTREEQLIVDTNVQQDFHPQDTAPFEDVECTNCTRLTFITRALDNLCQRIQAEEG